jgi:hypothetical protein
MEEDSSFNSSTISNGKLFSNENKFEIDRDNLKNALDNTNQQVSIIRFFFLFQL